VVGLKVAVVCVTCVHRVMACPAWLSNALLSNRLDSIYGNDRFVYGGLAAWLLPGCIRGICVWICGLPKAATGVCPPEWYIGLAGAASAGRLLPASDVLPSVD
jgi:hypothetical protein